MKENNDWRGNWTRYFVSQACAIVRSHILHSSVGHDHLYKLAMRTDRLSIKMSVWQRLYTWYKSNLVIKLIQARFFAKGFGAVLSAE